MGREENIQVFEDTMQKCQSDVRLRQAIVQANAVQKLILGSDIETWKPACRYMRPAQVIVSRKRTLEAASAYIGKKVCVLNFASATNPGGGVTRGSSAQEEAICRCSSLYFNLREKRMWEGFYAPHRAQKNPLHNDDCIYTPGVVVFKSDTAAPQALPPDEWYTVNVLTCAAPNLRQHPGNQIVQIGKQELRQLHEKRMRRIMSLAASEGNEVVILGAFGCGEYSNPPEVVAEAMRTVVREYRSLFQIIEFAVFCPPRDDSNYRVFERVLGRI